MEPLCENMASSTKPVVHNVSQRRQITASTDPRHAGNAQKKLVNYDRAVFELCDRADKVGQTDKRTYSSQYLQPLLGAKYVRESDQFAEHTVQSCFLGICVHSVGKACVLWCRAISCTIDQRLTQMQMHPSPITMSSLLFRHRLAFLAKRSACHGRYAGEFSV